MTTEEFKAKVLPYYKIMYRVAVSVLENDSEAADIVQEAMLKLYDRKDKLDNVKDIKSYCLTVVRNTSINVMRGRKELSSSEVIYDRVSEEDIHSSIECKDIHGYVDSVMKRLPSDQHKVLKLSAYGGLSNAEIADLLGISQGNVRVLLSRARSKIKELLLKNK